MQKLLKLLKKKLLFLSGKHSDVRKRLQMTFCCPIKKKKAQPMCHVKPLLAAIT